MTRSVDELMAASTRGEVLKGNSLVQSGRKNDAPVVIGVYAVGVVLSLIFSVSFYDSAGTRVLINILIWVAWIGVGYYFIAIGTKLSHNVATWGVALVAGVLAALNALAAVVGLASLNTTNRILEGSDLHVPGAGTFVSLLIISSAVSAVAFYLTIKMNRAMSAIASTPGAPLPQVPPHPPLPDSDEQQRNSL